MAFLYPPLSWYDLDFRILLLRAWLEHHGISTAELIRRDRETLRSFLERAARIDAATLVVHVGWWGAQFATLQRRFIWGFLAAARARMPRTAFVCCGDLAIYSPSEVLRRSPEMDACVTGDPFAVLRAIAGRPRERLEAAGLATRRGHPPGPAVDSERGPGVDLDAVPSPFRGLATDRNYDFTYSTALGCPFACTYCRTRAADGTVVRAFGIDRVVDDLERIARLFRRRPASPLGGRRSANLRGAILPYDTSVGGISLEDQTFTLDRARTVAICQALRKRPLGVPLGCVTRADLLDDDLLEELWAAGFRGMGIGVDAIDPRILQRSGRLRRLDDAGAPDLDPREYVARSRRAIERARARGFSLTISGVVGLDGSTPERDQALASWLAETGTRVQVNPFISYPRPLASERSFERPTRDARLERIAVPGSFMASHFTGRIDTLLVELDASRPVRPAELPVAVVLTEPAELERLGGTVSSGAHVFALGSQDVAGRIRASVTPLPAVCLIGPHEVRSEDPDERFEVSTLRVGLDRIVDEAGGLRLDRLAAPTRHPLVDRQGGVRLVETRGEEALEALVRFTHRARRGLRVGLPAGLSSAIVLVPDACAVAPGRAPVAPMRRIWIDGDVVRACPAGPSLGEPGASASRLAARQRREEERAALRRGCARCPAAEACPACPCGAGVSDEVYCRVMRRLGRLGPAPVGILSLLPVVAQTLEGLERWSRSASVLVPATATLPEELGRLWALFGPGGETFARDPARVLLASAGARGAWAMVGAGGAVEVPGPLARALARAQRAREPREILAGLADEVGGSRRAARGALGALLATCASLAAAPSG